MKFDDRLIQERLYTFVPDFANWRRWLAARRGPGHCGSIEWQYLPERLTEEEEKLRREEKPPVIEILPAIWMEEIVVSLQPTPRALLRLWWVRQKSAYQVVRTLQVQRLQTFPVKDFEPELRRWSRIVWVKVQSRKRARYNLLRAHGIQPEPWLEVAKESEVAG